MRAPVEKAQFIIKLQRKHNVRAVSGGPLSSRLSRLEEAL